MITDPEFIAESFVRAINRQDPDSITELMSDDHCFIDSLGNRVQGRESMRAGWKGYFDMVPDYSIVVDEILSDGPVVVMLGMAQGTYRNPKVPRGTPLKPENCWSTPAVLRAFIHEDKVAEWRVYADNDPLRKLMAREA